MAKTLRSTKNLNEKQLSRLRKNELVAGILTARTTIEEERAAYTRLINLLNAEASASLKQKIKQVLAR
jgi:hypothetical protein